MEPEMEIAAENVKEAMRLSVEVFAELDDAFGDEVVMSHGEITNLILREAARIRRERKVAL